MSASNNSDSEDDWDYKTPFRKKSEDISKREKFFGKEIFSPEQVEKARAAVGYPLQELTSHLLGGIGDVSQGVRALTGAEEPQKRLATSQDIKEDLGDTFVPKEYEPSEVEKRIGQGAGIFGSLLGTPVRGMTARSIPIASIGAPLVGASLKSLNAPEWAQIAGENAALVASSLRGQHSINRAKNLSYRRADRHLPQNAEVGASSLNNWTRAMVNSLERQGYNPKNTPLINKLNDIIKATSTGRANIGRLASLKQSIHDIMGDPATLKATRKIFPRLSRRINQTLERYGRTNPQWWENFRRGDLLHGGLENSKKATAFIRNKANPNNPLTYLVFGVKGVLGATGIAKGLEVLHRITTNPEMRRYYANALRYAFQGEARAMNYYVNKLDRKISKKFPPKKEDEEYEYSVK